MSVRKELRLSWEQEDYQRKQGSSSDMSPLDTKGSTTRHLYVSIYPIAKTGLVSHIFRRNLLVDLLWTTSTILILDLF